MPVLANVRVVSVLLLTALGTFPPGIGRRGQGEGSGAQREGGVIYESSGLPVTYPPQQGALPGEKEEKDIRH